MQVQGLGDSAGIVVVLLGQRDQRRVRRARAGIAGHARLVTGQLPHPQQGVLHQGQLVGVGADFVDDLVHHLGCHRGVELVQRPFDRLGRLVARQPRRQELAGADRFGQTEKRVAVAHELGPHRENHVHRAVGLLGGPQQQVHELDGVVSLLVGVRSGLSGQPPRRFAKPEQLLELVDQHQHGPVAGHVELVQQLDHAAPAGTQHRFGQRQLEAGRLAAAGAYCRPEAPARGTDRPLAGASGYCDVLSLALRATVNRTVVNRGGDRGPAERVGQVAERIDPGPGDDELPVAGNAAQIAVLQRRQQARADQGRFPEPLAPTTARNRCRSSRLSISFVCRARPKKIGASCGWNGRSPG